MPIAALGGLAAGYEEHQPSRLGAPLTSVAAPLRTMTTSRAAYAGIAVARYDKPWCDRPTLVRRHSLFGLVPAVLLILACGSDPPASDDDGSGGTSTGGGGPGREACDQYIECVSVVAPAGLADVIDAYGVTGSCWAELGSEQCIQACIQGTADFHMGFPDEPACGGGGSGGSGGGTLGSLSGDHFFALAPVQSAAKPAPFIATFVDGGSTFSVSLQPLDADDRVTPVGTPIAQGPFDAMSSSVVFASFTIPGETNPFTESALTFGDLTLSVETGSIVCGTVAGSVTMPVMLDISGSTFTIVPMVSHTEPPPVNCAGALADPL